MAPRSPGKANYYYKTKSAFASDIFALIYSLDSLSRGCSKALAHCLTLESKSISEIVLANGIHLGLPSQNHLGLYYMAVVCCCLEDYIL